LIIIGAGAAGLFAAANAPTGLKTLVLEKTGSPGQKLRLTGNGQCNLTNIKPIKEFLTYYGENGRHLRTVLFPFSNIALMEYFEQNGLPLITREDGKVFPASMKSSDVLSLLLNLCNKNNATIYYQSSVIEIKQQIGLDGSRFSIQTANEVYYTKSVLVATGGESYPQTGSDGSFFPCLEQMGFNLIPRRPASTQVFVKDYPYGSLSGLTFQNSMVKLSRNGCNQLPIGNKSVTVEGSLLLTHKGFSGPPILEISRYAAPDSMLTLSYLPARTPESLRPELIKTAAGDTRQISTILETVTALPRSFLEQICQRCDISKTVKASRLTGSEMGTIVKMLTEDSFEVSDTGDFTTAMTTAGGVCLDEINLRTMEAKRYPGLYFAGEVLDIDGDTGGYNLQFAFSSAMLAILQLTQ